MKRKQHRRKVLGVAFVSIVTFIHILPLFIAVMNSLRTNDAIARKMLGFPSSLEFGNYIRAWSVGNYASAYLTTIIIGAVSALLVMVTTGLAAYGLLKTNAYGKKFFKDYFVIGLAIPYFAMMVPIFFVFYNLGLVNSLIGMIILYTATNIPFCFMFVHAFIEGMPKELDESARIDGCTEIQNFLYNVLPLAKPILTSVLLIVFVNCWNEFLFSNLFLQNESIRTVALRFYSFAGKHTSEYGYMYAAAVITILPIIVIYLLTQNTFIEGMTAGSIKGQRRR